MPWIGLNAFTKTFTDIFVSVGIKEPTKKTAAWVYAIILTMVGCYLALIMYQKVTEVFFNDPVLPTTPTIERQDIILGPYEQIYLDCSNTGSGDCIGKKIDIRI